jgi:hypothetical protein
MAAICFEGLGRKYLPQVPSIAFYVAKDIVLLAGFAHFRQAAIVRRTLARLHRGFGVIMVAGLAWTFFQIFNPEHQSITLAILGMRSYWLWWLAPAVVATVLRHRNEKKRAIYVLGLMTLVIAAFAAVQFVSPADSAVNLYSVVDGQEQHAADSGIVFTTGRARVSSTFSFLSGFQDFSLLVPALLLSLGLEATDARLRKVALFGTLAAATVVPMSGSRAAIVLGAAVLLLTTWSAGLFFTVAGRRIMIGAIAGVVLATVAFPDAILGVQHRFDSDETTERISQTATVLPPVALATLDYPMFGIGTGMQQNARFSLKVSSGWESELEAHRYLVELGPVGFLLMWITRLGVVVALLRAYRILQRVGKKATAGAALSYAAMAFFGSLTFDHIWQSLFFVGCGFILAETVSAVEQLAAAREPVAAAPERASVVAPAAALSARG